MGTTLGQVGICNIALSKIGAQTISSIADTSNSSAVACNVNWPLAYLQVSRAHRWNCIMNYAVLNQLPQTPLPGTGTPSPTIQWEPNTAYAAGMYLAIGGAIYLTQYAYTSSANFNWDITTDALVQADYPDYNAFGNLGSGQTYPSSWQYKYALPADFVLLVVLNNNDVWGFGAGYSGNAGTQGAEYQIIGNCLYSNACQAVIQYVQNVSDTTQFDPLFANALAFLLASMIATNLRQDGGDLAARMLQEYRRALAEARTKDGGEAEARRFNSINSSRWNAARYWNQNG